MSLKIWLPLNGNIENQGTLNTTSRLPSGYTEVEYLESTGTQYIDTGVVANGGVKVSYCTIFKSGRNDINLIGLHNSSSPWARCYLFYYNNMFELGLGELCPTFSSGGFTPTNDWVNIEWCNIPTKAYVKVQNTLLYQNSTSTTCNTSNTLKIFNGLYPYADSIIPNKTRTIRIWNSSESLVRNLIPALRNSDNKPGMYDTVTDTFYTNVGSGEFNYGPDVTCSITNNGATVDDNGKIGKCYSFNNNGRIVVSNPCVKERNKWTCSFWMLKTNTSGNVYPISICNNNMNWKHGFIVECSVNGCRIQGGDGINSYGDTNLSSDKSGSNGSLGQCASNIWHHLAFVYTGSEFIGYLNGIEKLRFTWTYGLGTGSSVYLGHYAVDNFAGKLNDFRLYDEALSADQIKEISRGMVLHYKMCQPERSRNYFGTNYNKGQSIRLNDYSSDGSFTQFYNMTVPMSTFAGKQMTFSYEVRCDSGTSEMADVYNSNGDPRWLIQNVTCPAGAGVSTKWRKIVFKFTVSTDRGSSYNSEYSNKIEIYCPHGRPIYVKNMKLEEGWNDNPQWTPTPESINNWGTIEYDGSGFKNHGTVIAASAPTWSSDTKRYDGSYLFNGSQYIGSNNKFIIGTGDLTVSAWIKLINCNNSYQHILSCKDTGAASAGFSCNYNGSQQKFMWQFCDGSATMEIWTADTFPKSDIVGKWVHIVMVRNASDSRKGYFYINGVRKELASVPTILNISSNASNLAIGACGDVNYSTYRWNGNISDVRIYATALSQEDITNLYKLGR